MGGVDGDFGHYFFIIWKRFQQILSIIIALASKNQSVSYWKFKIYTYQRLKPHDNDTNGVFPAGIAAAIAVPSGESSYSGRIEYLKYVQVDFKQTFISILLTILNINFRSKENNRIKD